MPIQLGVPRPLLYLLGAALIITLLSWAQPVLVPLALAGLLGFILISPVAALERLGVPRMLSIAMVMAIVVGAVAAFGYVLSRQFDDFAKHMPEYSASIKDKLIALREARKGTIGQIQDTVEKVTNEIQKQEAPAPPQRVSVVPTQPTDVERLKMLLEPVVRPIATAGLVLILVIFVIAMREDIRDRLIRLVGRGRVTVTTRTLDEAGERISQYLFSQTVINAVFGIIIAGGLFLIGVPYALLWGVSAALLRFVPYLGSLLALLMPAALAFVGSDGWTATAETVALFLGMDVITAYVIEPILIGTRTGISSLALLVSAMFWTWLWGPVGLLLSTPLTVCLATIGKYVPEMEFLAVLLGDGPPLEPEVSFYQRLLAGDEEEAADVLEKALHQETPGHVFDNVVVPSLMLVERDRLREEISPAEYQFVTHTMLEIVRATADVPEHDDGEAGVPEQFLHERTVLGVPARNTSDEVALEMLSQTLGKRWTLKRLSTATLASEVLLSIEEQRPDVVCIAAQPPGGLSHARYLSKRIHDAFPQLPICVLRAGSSAPPVKEAKPLLEGVPIVTSFSDITAQLVRLLVSGSLTHETGKSDAYTKAADMTGGVRVLPRVVQRGAV